MRRRPRASLATVVLLICTFWAQAAIFSIHASASVVIHVTTTGNDAQDGLDWGTAKLTVAAGLTTAVPGDQVWVAQGTYVECITLTADVELYGGFAGTENLLSERPAFPRPTPDPNATILDGNRSGSVVTSPSGATTTTRIDGFTIRNGSAGLGGGIYCELSSSSPAISNNTITANTASVGGGICCSSSTITNNTITENTATSYGGGICCGSSSTVTNNTITGNTARSGSGGGICCSDSAPTIANNTITGNSATTNDGRCYFGGGGIYCYDYSSPTIFNNTITGNSVIADDSFDSYEFGGGGIYCHYSSPAIANNTITGNNASSGSGGGIYCNYYSSPAISNNTITGNNASSGSGGGICCTDSGPTIANTIVAFNSSGIDVTNSYIQALRYSCVYGNTAYNYSGITDPTGTDGNIPTDPKFVSASPGPDGVWGTADDIYSDLRLQPNSPCIDAGNNANVPPGTLTDLNGHPRIVDDPAISDCRQAPGSCGTAPIVDMGVYEYQYDPLGDDDQDGVTNANDLCPSTIPESPVDASGCPPIIPGDTDRDGDVDGQDSKVFSACVSGPNIPYTGDCARFDFDTDVDQDDFGVFQRCYSGEGKPADPGCAGG